MTLSFWCKSNKGDILTNQCCIISLFSDPSETNTSGTNDSDLDNALSDSEKSEEGLFLEVNIIFPLKSVKKIRYLS